MVSPDLKISLFNFQSALFPEQRGTASAIGTCKPERCFFQYEIRGREKQLFFFLKYAFASHITSASSDEKLLPPKNLMS
jgi:hypothetical protein